MEIKRIFPPGSEWLYYNIYLGSHSSELLLNDYYRKFKQEIIKNKWFFIKYNIPDLHLRIRFSIEDNRDISNIIQFMNQLTSDYINNDVISNIEISTYIREVERYGIETIEESETFFWISSKQALDIINIFEEQDRWKCSLATIDGFLNSFNYNIEERINLFEALKNSFDYEFNPSNNKVVRQQVNLKYRNLKFEIDNIFNDDKIIYIVKNYNKLYEDIFNKIILKVSENRFKDLLESYIHMHCNRIFKSNQRMNEWILYNIILNYYKSIIAKNKYN